MLINDNATTATAAVTAAQVSSNPTSGPITKAKAIDTLKALVADKTSWEQGAYKTSNELLYGILQRCYIYYTQMCVNSSEGRAAREGLEEYIRMKGYIFNASAHSITKIVKCVFGADRRRVSAYSIVLRRALADGIKPLDLPAFIRDAGGVEEVRLAKSLTVLTPKQRSDIAAAHVNKSVLATVQAEALSKCLDLARISEQLVLIATQQADGEVIINAVIKSDSVLTAALSSYYSDNKKTWKDAEASATTQSKQDQLGDSIEAAVQKQLAA